MARILNKIKPKWIVIIGIITLMGIGVAWLTLFKQSDHRPDNSATFTVRKGPLTISVIESGSIKAREQVIIKNEVEGKTSILWLIQEGARVKKGDLLIELDASNLMNERIDQEIGVQNAEAAYINSRENLAVGKNQAESDIDKAELSLNFAGQDLEKYVKGEYPNELKEAEAEITLTEEDLTRAREKLEWSKKLYDEKYISESELRADELAEKKAELKLELAINNLDLLKDFTNKKKVAELESDVKQAEMALERTKRKAKADVVQAEAEFTAKKSEFKRQKDKLAKIEEQIKQTKIYAPADGLVIYATSAQTGRRHRGVEPLAEGQEVRERQELIHLPTASAVKAEVAIHESSLKKVTLGLPVKVIVDAISEKTFIGKVAQIAPLPDAQSSWMNPDLKVYQTEIYLDSNSSFLRTGMSCKAEIIIAHFDDVMYIPVQAVLRVKGEPTVYIVNGTINTPRKVKTGMDNNRMIHIKSGLEPGEVVALNPPLDAAAVEPQKRMPSPEKSRIKKDRKSRAMPNVKIKGAQKKRE